MSHRPLDIAPNNHFIETDVSVIYEHGVHQDRKAHTELPGLEAGISMLSNVYDVMVEQPRWQLGWWARVRHEHTLLIAYSYWHPTMPAPAWQGSDQAFGVLAEVRGPTGWAEVAFFLMTRDKDLVGLQFPPVNP